MYRAAPLRRPARNLATAERLESRAMLSAGDLDPSFGSGGRVVLSGDAGARDVIVQPADDKVLVFGSGRGPFGQTSGLVVDRLNPDGTPDSTFGLNGRALINFGGSVWPGAMALQPDGKIVVAGDSGGAIALARLLPTGVLDTTFSGDGMATVSPGTGYGSSVFDVAVQPDGRIVLAGTTRHSGNQFAYSLLGRIRADGTADPTFANPRGFVIENLGQNDAFTGVALDSAGRVVVVGSNDVSSGWGLTLSRYGADGTLDTSFGSGGRAAQNLGGPTGNVVIDSAGRILFPYMADGDTYEIARYTPAGRPDVTWEGDGTARAGTFTSPDIQWYDAGRLAIQVDGKIVFGGTTMASYYADTRMAAARLNPDGTPDVTFGAAGSAVVPSDFSEGTHALALGVDGHVTLAGERGRAMTVVRLDPGPQPLSIRLGPDGTLTVTGTDGDDAVTITRAGGNSENPFPPGPLTVTLNSTTRTYAPNVVRRILITAGAGRDSLTTGPRIQVGVDFDGGAGADSFTFNGSDYYDMIALVNGSIGSVDPRDTETLTVRGNGDGDVLSAGSYGWWSNPDATLTLDGGDGGDFIIGSGGAERILGGAGNDTIHAREGAGAAADTIDGGSGTDSAGYDSADSVSGIETQLNSEIRGTLYNDADGDGTRDADELPLGGWYVYIDANANGARDPEEAYGFSQAGWLADGSYNYRINYLPSGTYSLRVEPLGAGWRAVSPSSGSRSVTLSTGETESGRNFAYQQTSPAASLSGVVFNDPDGDGQRNFDEAGVGGRTVYLDRDNDGTRDAGEPSTVTDAAGAWRFTGLHAATHRVRQVLPSGWRQTEPQRAEAIVVSPEPDQAVTGLGFGTSDRSGIRGTIFHDVNYNGVKDPGEEAHGGRAYLDLDNDGVLDPVEPTAVSNMRGEYSFGGLAAGTYVVRGGLQGVGYIQTQPAGDGARVVTLGPAEGAFGVDFGQARGASIVGYVFNNADGAGDAPDGLLDYWLPGRGVFLDADGDAVHDAGEPTAVTDAEGRFTFERLWPGQYTVRALPAPGWEANLSSSSYAVYVNATSFTNIPIGIRRLPGVAGRHVFYNNSALDGRSSLITPGDDAAIAADKRALLPGQTATFANVTSYAKGINGVMIDLAGLASLPALSQLSFRVGAGGNPSAWAAAPAPASFHVRPRGGAGGTDRLTVTWADGAIMNQWLQVTVHPGGAARLAAADVFYFGNLPGEAGNAAAGATSLAVTAQDVFATRANLFSPSRPDDRFDFNRDGRVDVLDLALVRRAYLQRRALQLISV